MGRTISVKIRPLNKVCAVSLSINAVIKVVTVSYTHLTLPTNREV